MKRKENFARELVRSSSYARKNTIVFLILMAISILILCFYPKKVKAYSQPTMTTEQAQEIINYFKNQNEFYFTSSNYKPSGDIISQLDSFSASNLAIEFNNKISDIPFDFSFDDVFVILTCDTTFSSFTQLCFDFWFTNNNSSNSNLGTLCFSNDNYPETGTHLYAGSNSKKTYRITIKNTYSGSLFSEIYNYLFENGTVRQNIFPKTLPNFSGDLYITNFNFVCPINVSSHIWNGNASKWYTLINEPLNFNEEIKPDDTESDYGYYFYESQLIGAIPVNKLSLQDNYSLDEWWYIGDDLSYNYNYYYYSGDEKISINDKINLNTSRNSGDTGTYYFPSIYRQNYSTLLNNTGFYLDITCSLNGTTETVIQDFYSFYTYSEVVDSGATGTISNNSGEVTGNIDLTGIQAGINNINNTLTQQPDFSSINISSGDVYEATGVTLSGDPYENFWLEITTGLGDALTDNSRHLTIDWLGFIHTVDPQYFNFTIPQDLRNIITTVTIAMYVWILARWVKEIINEIHKGAILTHTSANILEDDIYTIYM